jgi:hypothetical protein
MVFAVLLSSAMCVLPPPNPPPGATVAQMKQAQAAQIAWNIAVAQGVGYACRTRYL